MSLCKSFPVHARQAFTLVKCCSHHQRNIWFLRGTTIAISLVSQRASSGGSATTFPLI